MADQRNSRSDPVASWREWMAQSESRLNAVFNEVMATDGYGRLMGGLTKIFVSMQKTMTEGMERYFTALSLPTRSDVLDLGQRLSMIETRLLSIENNLAKIAGPDADDRELRVAAPRPPRTKRPSTERGPVS
jgi:Poly(R)-hydroxyalkanoic acid synthase subunit (PHA_synth_III_E)